MAALQSHVAVTGSVVGFAGASPLSADELLTLDVDLLVPATVEGVLDEGNAFDVATKVIVEGTNGHTTGAADQLLADRGVLVVPDILADAGGVLVSYFEWAQSNQVYWWSAADVNEWLERRMLAAWNHLLDVAAVERVADAHRLRGFSPP